MSSLNSRAGVYERSQMSNSHEEGHTTTGRFHTAQFTSVGIPVTTGAYDFEWINGKDEQCSESVRLCPPCMRAEMGAG
jgi:hypothetical protein